VLGWKKGPSTWGCLCSHRLVLEQAIDDGVDSLLILEDDVCFDEYFREGVEAFLSQVPEDWDGLMFGGQHVIEAASPLSEGGSFASYGLRTHALLRSSGQIFEKTVSTACGVGNLKVLHIVITSWGGTRPCNEHIKFMRLNTFSRAGTQPVRYALGRTPFRKYWNPPSPDLSVINCMRHSPLWRPWREHGWYNGDIRDRKN